LAAITITSALVTTRSFAIASVAFVTAFTISTLVALSAALTVGFPRGRCLLKVEQSVSSAVQVHLLVPSLPYRIHR
jgi:ABC-type transport system involved in cytochrome c biogenesis permease component